MAPRHNRKKNTGFRPSSVHQHKPTPNAAPSARELWPLVRSRSLNSRPLLQVVEHPHQKDHKGRPVKIPVWGAPTYRNVIEDGVVK